MPTSKEQELIKGLVPKATDLSSRQLNDHADWSQRVKDEAMFSARTTHARYVEMLKSRLQAVADRSITPQKAEEQLQIALDNIGYTPQKGFPGDEGKRIPQAVPKSMTDLSSSRRIQLILDTNIKKARSLGQMAAGEDPVFLAANPAWRLTRTGARKKPRGDWRERWQMAGASVAWKGAAKRDMVALKDSPIWEALGNGVGGYEDTVGLPYPPFAFGSGLAWVNVGRAEWERICKAEGMKVEEPKSPVHSSAGKVQQTDGDDTNGVPKQDLPDYAKSDEFQKRLREALAQIKESEAKKENAPESIVSTDRPLPPPAKKPESVKLASVKDDVFNALQVVKTRISFLENIQLRYYGKVLKRLTDMSLESGEESIAPIVEKARAAHKELRTSIVYMTRDRNLLQSYLDRLNGEIPPRLQMTDLYKTSADRMKKRAESIYRKETSRGISNLIEEAENVISSQEELT